MDPDHDQRQKQLIAEAIANAAVSRAELAQRLLDPRRNVDEECGYPRGVLEITIEQYRDLFDREPVANRVVQLFPRESWQIQPTVFEDDASEISTPFEKAWDNLSRSLRGEQCWYQDESGSPVWEHLRRADILSGIGHFGILLLGLDDGKNLDDPVEGVDVMPNGTSFSGPAGTDLQYGGVSLSPPTPQKRGGKKAKNLLFLRAFDESLVQIVQYEANLYSPRFGQPVMYLVTLNDPREQHGGIGLSTASVRVHWTRVIHLADNLTASEVWGVPRMRPVLNRLLDLRKLYASSAEGYWKSCFAGLSLETHPQLGGDVMVDKQNLRNMTESYFNGLDRSLTLMGMSAKTLAPQVVDPTSQINVQLEAICVQLGVPVRVFRGSERGELASSQDDASWNDRLRERQHNYVTPRVIVPFIDRLIACGVLPEPKGYSVKWPDLDSLGDADKASIAATTTQALQAYVAGGVENLLPPRDFLTRILGWEDAEADAVLSASPEKVPGMDDGSDFGSDDGGFPTDEEGNGGAFSEEEA